MQQHRQQQAATGIIEDPPDGDRQRDDPDDEHAEAKQVADEVGAKAQPILVRTRDEEEQQVPQAPEHPKQEGSHQRTRALLEARECEAPPSWFLPQSTLSDDVKKVPHQVGRPKGECWQAKGGESSRQGQDSDQQVPGEADAPEHIAAQQLQDARTSLRDGCHEEGGQRWPKSPRDAQRGCLTKAGKL